MFGSTEFVEEFRHHLMERAIVYLNVDHAIAGNLSLGLSATPTLYHAAVETARRVPNPSPGERLEGRRTVYDSWLYHTGSSAADPAIPHIGVPGGGSDHYKFLSFLAVPSLDFTYLGQAQSHSYALYHTRYETTHLVEAIYDRPENGVELPVHRAVAQFWAEMAIRFADAPRIPLNLTSLSEKLAREWMSELMRETEGVSETLSTKEDVLSDARLQLGYLYDACGRFVQRTLRFEFEIYDRTVSSDRRLAQRRVNQRLLGAERCFIKSDGVDPPRMDSTKRHLLYTLAETDSYTIVVMGGVRAKLDALKLAPANTAQVQWEKMGRELAMQISLVHAAVECAISELSVVI
jgi:hypothetical protein